MLLKRGKIAFSKLRITPTYTNFDRLLKSCDIQDICNQDQPVVLSINHRFLDIWFSDKMSQVFTSAILIVGSYYQLGTLPDFTEEFMKSLGNDVLKDLGSNYSV